jgi:hypothetical protein
MDEMIYFGDAVKALDENGRVGGYLIRFGDAKHKDLDGEYFDAEGYYGPNDGDGAECIFHHGIPIKAEIAHLSDHTFAPIKTKRDEIGIFAETVLDMADDYEKTVFSLVKKNKLGWSSGAAGHRVRKEKDGKITKWAIAEGSLTPQPAEPMNRAIPIKAMKGVKFVSFDEEGQTEESPAFKSKTLAVRLNKQIESLIDDGVDRGNLIKSIAADALVSEKEIESILAGESRPVDSRLKSFAAVLNVDYQALKALANKDAERTVKGMFSMALDAQSPSIWQLYDIYCGVVKKVAMLAKSSRMLGNPFDADSFIKEATEEFTSYLLSHVTKQVSDYAGNDEAGDEFYLKAIISPDENILLTVAVDLEDHSSLVVSALKGIQERFRVNHEMRLSQKAGRVLSDKNRSRIVAIMKEMQDLLDSSTPMATDTEKRLAHTAFLRLQQRTSKLGVTTNG